MPKAWISINPGPCRRRWPLTLLALCAFLFLAGKALAESTGESGVDWSASQSLAGRLAEEHRKLNGLREELTRLRFAAEELRDVQLYATAITRLQPRDETEMDRRIEALEADTRASAQKLTELDRTLADAVFVTREMAQESPNRDMVEILMKDNVDRIPRYLALNKELDSRWDAALLIVREISRRGGVTVASESGGVEDGFFRALLANLGGVASKFQEEFHAYKDSLARRGNQEAWEKMARLDLRRVEERLGEKSDPSPRAREWVLEDLEHLSRRYSGRISIGVIGHYLGEAWLANGQPLRAVEAFAKVTEESRMFARSRLGILRGFFAAGLDDSVLAHYPEIKGHAFPEPVLGAARFLAVQSQYALGRDSLVEREVLGEQNRGPYHYRLLWVYAKSLVRLGRRAEARRILGSLVGQSQIPTALRRVAGLNLAHLNYEDSLYESALRGYQGMLGDSAAQAEALYGMVWCNIRLGDLDGAEFVLKQLISQHPDNPWAVEAFMVFIRKLMVKAREEWAYRLQLDAHAAKLSELEKKLNERSRSATADDPEFQALRQRVLQAREALAKTKPMSPEGVAALYQQALDLCEFVEARYRTGEFSDIHFINEREVLLAKLREADGSDTSGTDAVGAAASQRQTIFRKLSETHSLALDIQLLHKSWLEELLRYYQLHLNQEMDLARGVRQDSARVRELQSQSRRLADEMSERLAAKSEAILQRIGEMQADPHSRDLMDELLFQRGYLLYTQEEESLKRRFALNRLLEDHLPTRGLEEKPMDYQAYEDPWMELIRRFPASPYVPAAMYYLGYSRAARGESELGLKNFEDLAARFPESPYSQQALIFIGEHYFNANDLVMAEKAYDKVLDHPESKYFDQALYKLAWTRYRANTYKSAISSFTYLLEESEQQPKQGGKSVLTQESLQYAALSLAESDTSGDGGFEKSQAFSQKLGDPHIGAQLLHKMASIYLQQGRLERAKRAFTTLLKQYPGYEELPSALMDLAQAYDKERNFPQGAEVREQVLRQYGPGTPWYKGLATPEAQRGADTLFTRAVDEISTHYLYEAKRANAAAVDTRNRLYHKAISVFEQVLSAYPEHPRAAQYLYQEAEAYYATEEYAEATRKYLEVSHRSDPKLASIGAYNAIVAAQELLKKTEHHAEK